MSFKKQMLAFAAVGAVTAATAVPAMALENDFHGMFRLRGIFSNAETPGGGWIYNPTSLSSGVVDLTKKDRVKSNTYVDQRARILYQAKANDDLKLVTHFEIDSAWGDNSYAVGRNNGGGIGADQVNLETKNVYLDFNIPSTPVNMKVGIQGFMDNYKGIIFSNDAAGAVAKAKIGNATIQGAFFRFDDVYTTSAFSTSYYDEGTSGTTNGTVPASAVASNTTLGANTRDFYNLGAKYSVTKDLSVGADYYLLYSDVDKSINAHATEIHMAGLNAEAKMGPATISGFAIYQAGEIASANNAGKAQRVNAYAANLAAKVKAGTGTARWTALYLSGDKSPSTGSDRSDFITIMERSTNTGGNSFYESGSLLLLRSAAANNTDKAVVYDLNNAGHGLITTWLGYDLQLGKAYVNTNAGVGLVAKKPAVRATNGLGDGRIVGAEINTEIGYKLYDNLSTAFQGAYVVLGDYFHGAARRSGRATNPENPYLTSIVMNYTF